MILIEASHFSDICVRKSSDTFESMNWQMVDCTRFSGSSTMERMSL